MSDGAREWRFYIDDMIAFAEKVLAYTAGMDQSAFVANSLVYDATLRNLELIGEARDPRTRRCPAGASAGAVAHGHCHAKPPDPRLSWHRHRHAVEHCGHRRSRAAAKTACDSAAPAWLTVRGVLPPVVSILVNRGAVPPIPAGPCGARLI